LTILNGGYKIITKSNWRSLQSQRHGQALALHIPCQTGSNSRLPHDLYRPPRNLFNRHTIKQRSTDNKKLLTNYKTAGAPTRRKIDKNQMPVLLFVCRRCETG
jgi:hypothetical protein